MKKQTKLGLVIAAAAVLSVSVASLVSAKGWVQQGADWFYVDNSGEAVTDTIQSSGNAKFYLGPDDGAMQKDYFLEDKDNATYYFGSNGAMVTNTWVAIESSRVDNQGDYIPDNYWYYFQASGKAMKGTSGNPKKTTIDGKKYLFNEYGQMLTGWIEGDGKIINPDDTDNPYEDAVYFAGGDNDGVLRAGWVTYYDGYSGDEDWMNDKTNLYFYFNTTNNKKIGNDSSDGSAAKTKKINGKTYAFASTGVMLSGWDVENGVGGSDSISSLADKTVYFSGEDDGHQVKKGWVYTVPASSIDASAYDDGEDKYMYFLSSGDAVKDQIKKINGKYYVFNKTGIMKTGLVIWCPTGIVPTGETKTTHYVDKVDTDWATGEEYSKKGILRFDSGVSDYYYVAPNGTILSKAGDTTAQWVGSKVKLHYFGDDGARKTGTNNIEFSDDTFSICTNAQGDKGSGTFAKKYYSLGIVLKASQDIKYGLYVQDYNSQFTSQYDGGDVASSIYVKLLGDSNAKGYQVLTTSGSKQKGATTAKKDADGNYWYINKENGDTLEGIWTVNVKNNSKGSFTAKTKIFCDLASDGRTRIKPSVSQIYNHLASEGELDNSYIGSLDDNTEVTSIDSDGYGTIKVVLNGYYYQTDYNGSSNKWIPFGWYDDAHKTCYMRDKLADLGEDREFGSAYYEVEPGNDYFLNCYWAD